VLVVGAGPAGLAAALAAGRSGARVILADERSELGGSLLDAGPAETLGGRPAAAWAASAAAELAGLPEVRLLPRTVVAGYYDGNYLVAVERRADHVAPSAAEPRQVLWKIRAKQVVLCTGAHERPLVFADNDRPGVMLAGAARSYVNRYDVLPGGRAVVFANHDGAYATALDLAAAGAAVPAVIDARPEPAGPAVKRARAAGIEVIAGSAIVATEGAKRVSGVEVMALTPDGAGVTGPARSIPCDLVAMSGGWGPAAHLFSQAGGKLRFDPDLHCFLPDAAPRRSSACAAPARATARSAPPRRLQRVPRPGPPPRATRALTLTRWSCRRSKARSA
jgi:sarcosine oxidase subunit alpha